MPYQAGFELDGSPSKEQIQEALKPVFHAENIKSVSVNYESEAPPSLGEIETTSTGLDALLGSDGEGAGVESDPESSEEDEESETHFTTKKTGRRADVLQLFKEFTEESSQQASTGNVIEYAQESDWDIPDSTISTYMIGMAKEGVLGRDQQDQSNVYHYYLNDISKRALKQLENDNNVDVVIA